MKTFIGTPAKKSAPCNYRIEKKKKKRNLKVLKKIAKNLMEEFLKCEEKKEKNVK